ncbi:MAG: ATP-binding protein [Gammaproteobacteria bacterium]|nr:ATP-binding protein [Gammaproteobacteria bacterium]
MRIWQKLTLALSALLMVVIITMAFAVQWTFDRGFLQYVSSAEATMSRLLADTIEDAYAAQGSWAFLRADRRALLQLFNNWSWRAGQRERVERQREALAEARTAFRRGTPPELLQIAGRVLVLDSDGRVVAGNTAVLDSPSTDYTLEVDDRRIGVLKVGRPERLTREIDLAFKQEQRKSLYLIGALLFIVTSFFAWLVARTMIAKPIRKIVDQGQRLAHGEYLVRSGIQRRDELGALARHLDALGHALAENERARRRWIADISHELRTPLTVLRGEVEALRDGVRQADAESLESLAAETDHLAKLVNDLYELSLSDIGALNYRKELLEPGELAASLADRLRPRFEAKGLQLDTRIDALDAEGEFDPDRLTQLLTNLLENSLRYTDAPGTVRITGNRSGDDYRLCIEDSAPGVSEADRNRLFERLYRVEASRNREHGGAGLGLAIVANIVKAHSGRIDVEASPLGGLRICIALPLHGGSEE